MKAKIPFLYKINKIFYFILRGNEEKSNPNPLSFISAVQNLQTTRRNHLWFRQDNHRFERSASASALFVMALECGVKVWQWW